MHELKSHDLPAPEARWVRVEQRPARDLEGREVPGLHNVWISLDNPDQLNSYTTEAVKEVILALRQASNDRAAVAVVFTAVGDRAFCSGGNTKEYAEYYAGRPLEYRQYMRLFNDMVSAILECDKPVVCRANGMRVGGGQELGMACDFTIASDLAVFSQAGPKHGSAPDGGATDFLPLFVGIENAMQSGTLCQPWSAHKFYRLGGLTAIAPVLRVDGRLVANPTVVTDRWLDEFGRIVHGEFKTGDELAAGKALIKKGTIEFSELDAEVERLCARLMDTVPDCLSKTIESLRKHKLEHWDRNRETNRAWLALNMVTEAKAGFRAFQSGDRNRREVDFRELRRRLARGEAWGEDLVAAISPGGGP